MNVTSRARHSSHPPACRAGPESKKMTAGRSWAPEEDDQLRTLAAANRDLGAVARELNRTEAAVIGRAYKLSVQFGKPKTRGLGAQKIEKPASQ